MISIVLAQNNLNHSIQMLSSILFVIRPKAKCINSLSKMNVTVKCCKLVCLCVGGDTAFDQINEREILCKFSLYYTQINNDDDDKILPSARMSFYSEENFCVYGLRQEQNQLPCILYKNTNANDAVVLLSIYQIAAPIYQLPIQSASEAFNFGWTITLCWFLIYFRDSGK